MNASNKQLKAILMLKMRKLSLAFIIPKLGEFSLFNNFYPNLVKFWDLDNFLLFKFLDLNSFLIFGFTHFSINLSLPLILPTLLAISILLVSSICNDIGVFSIDISDIAILLNFYINY